MFFFCFLFCVVFLLSLFVNNSIRILKKQSHCWVSAPIHIIITYYLYMDASLTLQNDFIDVIYYNYGTSSNTSTFIVTTFYIQRIAIVWKHIFASPVFLYCIWHILITEYIIRANMYPNSKWYTIIVEMAWSICLVVK